MSSLSLEVWTLDELFKYHIEEARTQGKREVEDIKAKGGNR